MDTERRDDKKEREERHRLECLREQADVYCKGEDFPRVMMEDLCEQFLVLADEKLTVAQSAVAPILVSEIIQRLRIMAIHPSEASSDELWRRNSPHVRLDEVEAVLRSYGVPSASAALNDNCWKCGRHFTVGRFECRESPCGAIVDKDGNVTAKISPTDRTTPTDG